MRLHEVQIHIWNHIEDLQNLIEHLPMLAGYANVRLKFKMLFQLQYQWAELYRFRPSAKNEGDSFHFKREDNNTRRR